ncbi:putative colanic acid biosynthesis acetyltransferase [Gillisia sp. M10.2A]|uniref:Colanic acid biosynthesis acetyltransferase n=1 Tax=Gillisia lutea TaxID=2909668 RepID=A0ABS9EH58_9FLAO|nr:putative colanic acid biosynthesis acetyltransferase [Gillisia lutea]MCF4102186.1 putative colanic acid biosynthesis acetyltransferase [Gillisia lutea]
MSTYTKDKDFVDLTTYSFSFSFSNKAGRLVWNFCYWIFFRPFSLSLFKKWRIFVLRTFGAKIGTNSDVHSNVKIWAPWNLELGSYSSIGPKVDCYNQGKIRIGNHSIISQKTYLCASSHDFTLPNFPLILKPINIMNQVWIAADAFIAPGVTIGEGAVIAARAGVFKDIEDWTVAGGNPAKRIKERIIKR